MPKKMNTPMMEESSEMPSHFSLSSKHFPIVKKWRVGEIYSLSDLGDVKIEQMGAHKRDDGSIMGEFEVTKASSDKPKRKIKTDSGEMIV